MRESQECLFNRGKPLRSSVHGRWFKCGVNSGELAICLNIAAFPLWASLLISFQNLENFSFSNTVSGSVRVCICFLTGARNILWFRCHHHVGILCFSCSVMDVQEKANHVSHWYPRRGGERPMCARQAFFYFGVTNFSQNCLGEFIVLILRLLKLPCKMAIPS